MAAVQIIVPDVPRRVRQALVRYAKREKISVNEAATRILAEHYDVEREPIASRFVPVNQHDAMKLRVPAAVRQALRQHAAVNGSTMRGLVIAALAEALGLPQQSTERRARR